MEEKKHWFKQMKPWQKKRLFCSLFLFLGISLSFLIYTTTKLYADKVAEDQYWDKYLEVDPAIQKRANELSKNATKIKVGTYIENLKEINLKSNNFSADYLIWFNWDGKPDLDMAHNFRIYKGNITKLEVVDEYHNGNHSYQLVRVSVVVSKTFWTPRFPLESHQLRIYLEANPLINEVIFVKDDENKTNPNLSIAGYDFTRSESAMILNEYVNNNGDPRFKDHKISSEYVTQIEINRSDFGTYFKCFIALLGTSVWVFITLYINTNHHVDPLGMIPAALFGTVSNIMVGANLLPDALQTGLMEYVNFWGILTILSVTFTVINVNRIRSKYEDREFAHHYGMVMFVVILTVILLGHFLLPLSAYRF